LRCVGQEKGGYEIGHLRGFNGKKTLLVVKEEGKGKGWGSTEQLQKELTKKVEN